MITVKFYNFGDSDSEFDIILNDIADRFTIDYPEASNETDYDEDEEEFSITFNIEVDDLEDIDTFLCEEICHEQEVHCEIRIEKNTKNYYFDEEDEWFYK